MLRKIFRSRRALLVAGLLGGGLVALIAAGCATIIHGTMQSVSIASTPPSATVTVDKMESGTTPLVARLSRKEPHSVRIELAGYQPYDVQLKRGVDGWVWGNIVFGGLIGLAVDAISGGMYKLTPEQVQAELKKEGVAGRPGSDLYIGVVLSPDPTWKPIGTLQPVQRP